MARVIAPSMVDSDYGAPLLILPCLPDRINEGGGVVVGLFPRG